MITKTANAFLSSAGKWIGKKLLSPTNLALGSFLVSSGTQSVGEGIGMTAGGVAASDAYGHLSKNYLLPKAMSAASKLPGRYGAVAKGAVGLGNMAAGIAVPLAGSMAAGKALGKMPIYQRKSPLPEHIQA